VAPPDLGPALRLAATVVLLRPRPEGLEALLTRRPTTMRFAPDLHVFPGGAVEANETSLDAAVRETREETGIVVAPGALVPVGRWVTPAGQPSRFDARFFAVVVDGDVDVLAASDEVVSWQWLAPRAALDLFTSDALVLWPPTLVTLQQLEGVANEHELRATFLPPARDASAPRIERLDDDVARLEGGWAGGVEGRSWQGWIVGRREWVVVNPGDPTGATTDAVVAAADAAGAALAGVVVTSLGPEHHAGASLFAVGLGLPFATPPGVPRIARDAHVELEDGSELPFGDVSVRVRVNPAQAANRWADQFSEVRLEGPGWELP